MKVLVAEDNEVNFELVRDVLELDGHTVIWARHGGEALTMARSEAVDLLVLDLHLPQLSGREVLRRLRSEPPGFDAKILVLSADAMAGTREETIEGGADAFLSKPFHVAEFRAAVAELLQ